MGIKAILVIVVAFLIFVGVLIAELVIEAENRYYACYQDRLFKGKADNFACRGKNEDGCKRCPYLRKYQKEQNNENKGKS